MGREIKRVPLDFEWPLNKVWQGFLTPDEAEADRINAALDSRNALWAREHARTTDTA